MLFRVLSHDHSSLLEHLMSRDKYYAVPSFMMGRSFEVSDMHSLGYLSTEILQGLTEETAINENFIEISKSIAIGNFTWLLPSSNKFANTSDENFVDPCNMIALVRANCKIDFNAIINAQDPKQTAPGNCRAIPASEHTELTRLNCKSTLNSIAEINDILNLGCA